MIEVKHSAGDEWVVSVKSTVTTHHRVQVTACRTTGKWCSTSWKPSGKANNQERGAYFHLLERALQMRRRETPQHHRLRQCRAIQFDHRHVDLATGIVALVPDTLAVEVQRHRDTGRTREILGVGVEFDLEAVGEVLARLVDHHVSAGREKQPALAPEEEAARRGERTLAVEGRDPCGGQQQRLNQGCL